MKLKRSQSIVLLLSGALATTLGPAGCARDDGFVSAPMPPNPENIVSLTDADQQNNSYVPGVGYYHTSFGMWYPYPFNWYYAGRGYYYGGGWHGSPYIGIVPLYSRPSRATYVRVNTYYTQHINSPRYSAPASRSSPSVTRGGFGAKSYGSPSIGG